MNTKEVKSELRKLAKAEWPNSIFADIEYDSPAEEAFAQSVFECGYIRALSPTVGRDVPYLERRTALKNKVN